MYLIFDTETSDLPRFDLPADHSSQGRICQLGCLLLDSDFKERNSFCSFIKPNGWKMSSGASARNNITDEMCISYGIPIGAAMAIFDHFAEQADWVVAHNIKFDAQLIDIEQALNGGVRYDWNKDSICTMLASTNICKLNHPKIKGRFKWPKLEEAHAHMYPGEVFADAHNALADCRITAKVLRWLITNGHVNILQEC